jgi:tight adherence protein B
MELIIIVLVFAAILFAAESFYFFVMDQRDSNRATARKRLRNLAVQPGVSASSGEESILRPAPDQGPLIDRLLHELPGAQSLELLLYRAGVPLRPQVFVARSLFFALAAWAVGFILLLGAPKSILLLGVGLLPVLVIAHRARKRMELFEVQLPDALELMTRALRAGHSLTFGFQMVGQELADPIGTEFARVADEIKLGQDVRSALAGLAYRINALDLPFFITAILIQRETGGNLTEILDKLGYVIRERFKLYGKVRALTSIGRASANLLAIWPLVMVGALAWANVNFVAPLWESQEGHMIVAAAVTLVIIGYIICRRMAVIRI